MGFAVAVFQLLRTQVRLKLYSLWHNESLYRRTWYEASFPKRSIRGVYFGGGCVFTYVRAPYSPLQQVQFPGPRYGLGAAVRLELTVDVVDVLFDGAHGDEQSLRNPPVRLAGGDETQHLQLALRQRLAERTGIFSRFHRRQQRGASVKGHQQFACVIPGDAERGG